MIMAAGVDLLAIYIGLELMSLAIYALAGFVKRDPKSIEAALKYFLMGSFSSGVLLYGLALLYGLTGSTQLAVMAEQVMLAGYQSRSYPGHRPTGRRLWVQDRRRAVPYVGSGCL